MVSRNGEKKARTVRELLGMVGTTAAATALAGIGVSAIRPGSAASTAQDGTAALPPSCVLTPEATEGPYYLDLLKIREDITEDVRGVPVRLRTTVVDTANDCQPLKNAAVDISGTAMSAATTPASWRTASSPKARPVVNRPREPRPRVAFRR